MLSAPTGQEAIEALSSYFLKVTKIGQRRLHVVFDTHIGPESVKHFESTYDRITRESKAEGKAEGNAEGLAEGLANAILRMVARRFGVQPPEFEARIRSASIEELDLWTDRVLDVESATELFTT